MFFKDSVDDGTSIVIPSIYTRITIIASLAITVVLGVFPAPVLDYIAQTASFLR
jgi:NADH-quinone oxidoreductase subunit N